MKSVTSFLHSEVAQDAAQEPFIQAIEAIAGSIPEDVIYVRTGGTEGLFKQQYFPGGKLSIPQPVRLLTSGKSNSLAASLEILSYLQQQGLQGEVLHGSAAYLQERVKVLETVARARMTLRDTRIGVIGEPSDWLIASQADPVAVADRLGASIVPIPMEELLCEIPRARQDLAPAEEEMLPQVRKAFPGATQIYHALEKLVEDQHDRAANQERDQRDLRHEHEDHGKDRQEDNRFGKRH